MGRDGGFLRSLLDVVLPPLCHVCHSFTPATEELHICPDCRDQLPFITGPHCSLCGIPFIGVGSDHPCGACLAERPVYDSAAAPLRYEGAVSELIHGYKYGYRTVLRRPLALLMLERLEGFITEVAPEVMIPVPLHQTRMRQRGFNQALLLAEPLSRRWGIPLLRGGMVRIRPTEPQVNLAATERKINVRGAFAVADVDAVNGRRVLLVDDVLTTGSTANECARILKEVGASQVRVVTVARAV